MLQARVGKNGVEEVFGLGPLADYEQHYNRVLKASSRSLKLL